MRRRTRVETLTYAIPAAIAAYIRVGSQVTVSVGQQTVTGVVLKITRVVPRELRTKLKDVQAVDKNALGFSPPRIKTIEKLADYYGASLAEIAFHALAIPSPITTEVAKVKSEKPIFVQAPWPDRLKFYQNIITKHGGKKRLIFLFPVESFVVEFVKSIKTSTPVFADGLTAAQNRALNAAIANHEPVILAGGLKWAFFPLRPGDVLVVDQPDHVGLTSQRRPFLAAKQIGLARAAAEGIQLVLGADAPSVGDYVHSQNHDWRFLRQKLTPKQLTIFNKTRTKELLLPNFAEQLAEAVTEKQKILVLAASRGWAGALYCRDCQEVQPCPNCGRPIGLKNERELLCAYCGVTGPRPARCRRGHESLISLGEGVTQVVTAIKSILPKVIAAELSGDVTTLPTAQIIVATEKILSFPAVTFDSLFVAAADRLLSGVTADGAWHSLTILLALRARTRLPSPGTGGQAKNIFIQTHFPDHWVWSAVTTGYFGEFYQSELVERKKYRLPPFGQELQLLGRDKNPARLQKQARDIVEKLNIEFPAATIAKNPPRPAAGNQHELSLQLYRPTHFSSAEKHHLRSLLPPSWTVILTS